MIASTHPRPRARPCDAPPARPRPRRRRRRAPTAQRLRLCAELEVLAPLVATAAGRRPAAATVMRARNLPPRDARGRFVARPGATPRLARVSPPRPRDAAGRARLLPSRDARGRFVAVSELARSRGFVQRVLNLPLYFGMPEQAVGEVVQAAREILR